MTYARIASQAATIRPLRLALSVLAAPFYAIGWLIGLLVVAVVWCVAGAQVGYSDARRRKGAAE